MFVLFMPENKVALIFRSVRDYAVSLCVFVLALWAVGKNILFPYVYF